MCDCNTKLHVFDCNAKLRVFAKTVNAPSVALLPAACCRPASWRCSVAKRQAEAEPATEDDGAPTRAAPKGGAPKDDGAPTGAAPKGGAPKDDGAPTGAAPKGGAAQTLRPRAAQKAKTVQKKTRNLPSQIMPARLPRGRPPRQWVLRALSDREGVPPRCDAYGTPR